MLIFYETENLQMKIQMLLYTYILTNSRSLKAIIVHFNP